MPRHQNYSKRSRESRKAMTDGAADADDVDDDPGCCERIAEDWSPVADDLRLPPDPVS
ncbi:MULTISPECIES: hypothetical protein [unclassified Mycobacterium]|uniref:hypothetical protein n=1 Tax=unclassified Mycobacterium TaxID=2642494 RepID=UPI0038775911